jgi:hypothetical protein
MVDELLLHSWATFLGTPTEGDPVPPGQSRHPSELCRPNHRDFQSAPPTTASASGNDSQPLALASSRLITIGRIPPRSLLSR